MFTNVLETRDTWLRGLDRHTYWLMPLDLVWQSAWYKLLGFSLFRQRLLSILWGGLLLFCWSRIVFRLTGMRLAAILTAILIGFESNFLYLAGNGRMEMMCAALGSAGIAAWLEMGRVPASRRLVVAHALTAAAVFTHPCGVLLAAVLLLLHVIDKRRLTASDLLFIAIPYVAGAGLWGIYIAQAPGDFYSQFHGNTSGFAGEYLERARFNGLLSPFSAIGNEVRLRYLEPFGFYRLGTLAGAIKAVWLMVAGTAFAAALCVTKLRTAPGVRTLVASGALVFLLMAFLEGFKFGHYLIYPLPFLAAVTAVTVAWLWKEQHNLRAPLAVLVIILIAPRIKAALDLIRLNPLRNETGLAAAFLEGHNHDGDKIIAGAEFGYFFGFEGPLDDDVRLGYYTGLRPRYICTSDWYRQWHHAAERRDPRVYSYLTHLLSKEYRQVFATGEYLIYERVE